MAITHKVEIAFATQPYAVTPTWTDVTAYTQAVGEYATIRRGRGDLFDSPDPSTLSLTLDNKDGRFTPGYTAGAYYPNVVLGKRIRVSTNAGSGFVTRFDGFIDTWPTTFAPTGRYAEANISAVDRTSKLGRQLVPTNIVSLYVLADGPTDYWTFGDAEGTVTPFNQTGITALRADNTVYASDSAVIYGSGTGVGVDGLTAVQTVNSRLMASGSPSYRFDSGGTFTVEGWVRLEPGTTGTLYDVATFTCDGASPGTLKTFRLSVSDTAYAAWDGAASITGTTNLLDGKTHHVACTFDATTLRLYVDGVQENSTTPGAFSWQTDTYVSTVANAANSFPSPSTTMTTSHVAVYTTALTAARVLAHAGSGTGFAGETSLQRFARIAGLAGVTAVTTGTAGTQSMSALTDVQGASYGSLLNDVAATEEGFMFAQTTGEVRLRPRTDLWGQATKWALTNGQYGVDLVFLLDDYAVVNDAVMDRPNGEPVHVINATSIADNGTYSKQQTLLTTSDLEVLDRANAALARGVPATRSTQVTVDLLTQTSLVPIWLTMECGDIISLSSLPSQAPSSSITLSMQGYTETIGLDVYSVTMNTSAAPSHPWILGDATWGVLGTTTVLGY